MYHLTSLSLDTPIPTEIPLGTDDLSAAMLIRGAAGVLAGAAAAPKGKEGIWAAAGFVAGVVGGQVGIAGILGAALYKKMDRSA